MKQHKHRFTPKKFQELEEEEEDYDIIQDKLQSKHERKKAKLEDKIIAYDDLNT